MSMFNEISGFTVYSDPSRGPQKDPHTVGKTSSALRKFIYEVDEGGYINTMIDRRSSTTSLEECCKYHFYDYEPEDRESEAQGSDIVCISWLCNVQNLRDFGAMVEQDM